MNRAIVDRFKRYVKINSESGNEKEFSEILIEELKSMNLKVIQDKKTKRHNSNTSNIIAYLEPKNSADSVILSAHMDTVKPGINVEPLEKNGVIFSKKQTILGADDKAGIAIIIDVLIRIKKNAKRHKGIEVVFTVHEEAGLYGVKALDFSLLKSKKAIVLDSSGEVGGIITKAPYKTKIKVDIEGKAAHAGIAPQEGKNAILVASDAISKMKLSEIDKETTCNIGKIEGGEATNVVPNNVEITGEVRSLDRCKLDKQIKHLKKCVNDSTEKFGVSGDFKPREMYPGYNIKKEEELVSGLIKAGNINNIKMYSRCSRGGSDANIFNEKNIRAVNLAIGTKDAHTENESIEIKSLIKCSDILYSYLTE